MDEMERRFAVASSIHCGGGRSRVWQNYFQATKQWLTVGETGVVKVEQQQLGSGGSRDWMVCAFPPHHLHEVIAITTFEPTLTHGHNGRNSRPV